MKSNYLIVLLALLASGFMGCSDDDSYDWFGEHEKEKDAKWQELPQPRHWLM